MAASKPLIVEIHFSKTGERRIDVDGEDFHGPSPCQLPPSYEGIVFPSPPPEIAAQLNEGIRRPPLPAGQAEVVRVFQQAKLREMGAWLYGHLIPEKVQGAITANFGKGG